MSAGGLKGKGIAQLGQEKVHLIERQLRPF
jgi:hypothetical protein